MTEIEISCWKCGSVVEDLLLPLSRTEECRNCGSDLHVCRMCRFYDRSVSNACREPVADFVAEKTRANFCGYLELLSGAGAQSGQAADNATQGDLDALFGLGKNQADADTSRGGGAAPTSLDDLFDVKGGRDE